MQKVNFLIGAEFFRKIRENNCYYIDKTAFIEELLTEPRVEVSLITRPRRFGKTLTMDMLKEFFDINGKGKKNIFEGLYISKNEELCKKWQNQYPVVYLTLKDCEDKNFVSWLEQFASTMKRLCQKIQKDLKPEQLSLTAHNFFQQVIEKKADQSTLKESLRTICDILRDYYNNPVILLIDEYDVPINYAYHKGYYNELIEFMRNFLGTALKGNENLEFAVLTGCLRIAKESIFTGLNNFKCFGISDITFSNAIGFTSEEVDKILFDAGLEDKKPLIKEWYDGYTFGDNSEMYCPWDVSNYIVDLQSNPKLEPKLYWNTTSGNTIIRDFLESKNIDITDDFQTLLDGGCVEIRLSDQQTYKLDTSSINNFWNIMYLTGYLTKASEEKTRQFGRESRKGCCLLTIPNKEVREIYETTIREWIEEGVVEPEKNELIHAFWENDAEKISEIISYILNRSMSCRDYYESFYHGTLFGLFFGKGCEVLSNRESGLGYYDLLITHPRKLIAALIEIKRADSLESLEKEAKKALEQIEKNQYKTACTGYRDIRLWGMAFYQKRCIALVKKVENSIKTD